ncbi:MAG: hypothetical protein AB1782_02555 [Cyanobacteriota bacterium]
MKSVDETLNRYDPLQQALLHIDLANIYVKNADWKNFYVHLKKVFKTCPKLQKAKILFNIRDNGKINNDQDIIDINIVKKLSKLGLKDINTRQKALNYLQILRPTCERICIDPTNNKDPK